jgi:hypothetical protein
VEQIGAEINAAQIERLHNAAARRGLPSPLLRWRNFLREGRWPISIREKVAQSMIPKVRNWFSENHAPT